MTKLLAFSACVAALVAVLALPGNADPARTARHGAANAVTADDVDANLRRSGLAPSGEIVRHGDVFVTHAVDPRGIEVRVVAEALFGDVVSVAPRHLMVPYPVRYDSGPRIIHIPGRGGGEARAALPERDTSFDDDDDAPVSAVPPPRERMSRQRTDRDDRAAQPRRQSRREREPRHEPRQAKPRRELRQESRQESRQGSHQESRRGTREAPRQVLPYETPYKSRSEAPKPQAKLEVKANRSVLAIPPMPVEPPAMPRWQAQEKHQEKFGAPSDSAVPPPLASKTAAAAQASANEPVAAAPAMPDTDAPPEGVTTDPAPAQ